MNRINKDNNIKKDTKLNKKVEKTQAEHKKQKKSKKINSKFQKVVKNVKKSNKKTIALLVTAGCLTIATVGLVVGISVQSATISNYGTQLDNVYKKNLYELVESVNNTETKLSKIVVSNNKDFQNKTLLEISNNADMSEQSLATLPISRGTLNDSFKFINKVSGFSKYLAEKIAQGGEISQSEFETLAQIKISMKKIQNGLNEFMTENQNNYSVLDESLTKLNEEQNAFTIKISKIENQSLEIPVMIFDGPFSDSQLNTEIKGLTGDKVTQEKAFNELSKCFKNISNHTYDGEISSRFDTYNFSLETSQNHKLFAQVSKIGGNIITVCGTSDGWKFDKINMEEGKKIALMFAKENGVEDAVCVWQDELKNEGYFNIAPQENGIILYPDLVKVKVDLSSGVVIGYDATTYFSNHTNRRFPSVKISKEQAKLTLPKNYQIEHSRIVLAPIDFKKEVLCWEIKARKENDEFYFYINAVNGKEENILKVVKTNDGSKLM